MFPTQYADIIAKMKEVNPSEYARSRNFLDGKVSYLSPYLSRGVISTKMIWEYLQSQGIKFEEAEKFVQELAWRDYYQRVWQHLGDKINYDIKSTQINVRNTAVPSAVIVGKTGIESIDSAISHLYKTGYMHNHCRMYTAFLTCNVAQSHWLMPAKWLYYHLLDADWASNACSWQWVAGTFSSKKYVANQENINKYTYSKQQNTYLDVPYEKLENMPIPAELKETIDFQLSTPLPPQTKVNINSNLPTFLYNFYQLDPLWHQEEEGNRILLIEPSHFEKYPISAKSMDFMLDLAQNIKGIQVYLGEFSELKAEFQLTNIYYKEHHFSKHYEGEKEERDFLFPEVSGYFPSFFGYWKKCMQYLSF